MSSNNTFKSLNANYKQSYADDDKKFKRTKKMLAGPGKANSEAKASANPMKALHDKSYLNLRGKKGIAV